MNVSASEVYVGEFGQIYLKYYTIDTLRRRTVNIYLDINTYKTYQKTQYIYLISIVNGSPCVKQPSVDFTRKDSVYHIFPYIQIEVRIIIFL